MPRALIVTDGTHRELCQGCGVLRANAALFRLDEVREFEARRIANVLHAEAGQLLAAVYLALDEISEGLDPSHREGIRQVRRLLDRVEQQFRQIAHELRPRVLDELGLAAALAVLAQGVSKRSGLTVSIAHCTEERLPSLIETTLYRVVQEALNNVVAHAHASRVRIEIRRRGGAIHCMVSDNGAGFDVRSGLSAASTHGGLGLAGINERIEALGGRFSITSGKAGTTVVVTLREIRHVGRNPVGRRSRDLSAGPSSAARAARVRGGRRGR